MPSVRSTIYTGEHNPDNQAIARAILTIHSRVYEVHDSQPVKG